jgi:hypothetical protein
MHKLELSVAASPTERRAGLLPSSSPASHLLTRKSLSFARWRGATRFRGCGFSSFRPAPSGFLQRRVLATGKNAEEKAEADGDGYGIEWVLPDRFFGLVCGLHGLLFSDAAYGRPQALQFGADRVDLIGELIGLGDIPRGFFAYGVDG